MGADGDEAVDVGGPVQGIEGDDVVALALGLDLDGQLVLLRDQQGAGIRGLEHVDEQLVGKDIKLLYLLAFK